ncbi:MAG: hypothetical protein EXS05_01710 [Planctomycetaceae bacterium]|nr:hypothetical protein [Planctomycetaceae bacterium]
MIRFHCPQCSRKMQVEDRHAGRSVKCPYCGQRMRVAAVLPEISAPEASFELPAENERLAESAPRRLAPQTGGVVSRRRDEAGDAPLVAPRRKIDFEELIDMTAMVDIVFFLLIFFLVTSMHALDSTIPMPVPDPQHSSSGAGGAAQAALDSEDSQIIVRIDRNDVISVEGIEIRSPQELLFRLRELRNGPGRPEKLLVLGSGDASHGAAVLVLDAGHEVEMEQVRLAIRDETE